MAARNDLDHDPTAFDPLDGVVARVDGELLTNRLLDRDLTSLSYFATHVGMVSMDHTYVNGYARLHKHFCLGFDATHQLR